METKNLDANDTIQFTDGDRHRVIPVDENGKPLVGVPSDSSEYGSDGAIVIPEYQQVGKIFDRKA